MTVRIVTDSASDIPQSLADANNISIVPLSFRFGKAISGQIHKRDLPVDGKKINQLCSARRVAGFGQFFPANQRIHQR